MDNQVGAIDSLRGCDLEVKQINHQQKYLYPSGMETNAVHEYGGENHNIIDEYLLTGNVGSKYEYILSESELIEVINNLDSIMMKSPGLVKDTKLFRYGYFDVNLNPGDKGIWKAYTSTSFQRRSAEAYGDYSKYYIEIFANKNTKGLALNDDRINGLTYEHEYLLPRNQEYQVLEVDHINKTVKVLLL